MRFPYHPTRAGAHQMESPSDGEGGRASNARPGGLGQRSSCAYGTGLGSFGITAHISLSERAWNRRAPRTNGKRF